MMRVCPLCRSIYNTDVEFCGLDGERLVLRETDPHIGTTIDRYQVIERLGVGGMSAVYRATHQTLSREYAIKVLFGEMAAEKKVVERFRREAQASSQISHPNVVQVVDYGTTERGLTFLVMELIEGQSLNQVIKQTGPLPPPRIAEIARQVAEGLSAAHALGFVHRDLKPGNVMLTPRDGHEIARILDFGLVRMIEGPASDEKNRLTQTGHSMGTPYYMSPEQIRGEAVSLQTDLYALGTVLYEMISGRPPFKGTMTEILIKHATQEPETLSTAAGLEHIAHRLLEKEPEDRLASAKDVVAAIDGLDFETWAPVWADTSLPGTKVAPKVPRTPVPARAPRPVHESAATLGDTALVHEAIGRPGRVWLWLAFVALVLVVAGATYNLLRDDDAVVVEGLSPTPGAAVADLTDVDLTEVDLTEVDLTEVSKADVGTAAPKDGGVTAALEVTPDAGAPVPSPPAALKTSERTPARPKARSKPRPKPRAKVSMRTLDRGIKSALEKRGLTLADLAHTDAKSAAADWRASRAAGDIDRAKISQSALVRAIADVKIGKRLLKKRLDRVKTILSRVKLSPQKLEIFEARYLELLTRAVGSSLDEARAARLLAQIRRLERDVQTTVD